MVSYYNNDDAYMNYISSNFFMLLELPYFFIELKLLSHVDQSNKFD